MNTTAKFKFDRVTLTAPLRVSVVSDDSHGAFGGAGVGAAQGLPEGMIDAAGWLKLPDGQPYPLACARPGIDPVPPLHRLTVYDGVAPVMQVQFRPVLSAPDAAELDINAAVAAGRAQVATPEQIRELDAAMRDAKAAAISVTAATTDLSAERKRVDEALAATITAQSTLLTGSVAEVADLPTDAAEGDSYLVRQGMSVYTKGADGWAAQYRWQTEPAPAASGGRTADALADSVRGAEVTLHEAATINRIRLYVAKRHTYSEALKSQNLLQLAVYKASGVRVIDGGVIEWPEPGWYEFACPPTALHTGVYYIALSSSNTATAKVGLASSGGVEQAQQYPPPATLSLGNPVADVPATALLPAQPPRLLGGGIHRKVPVAVISTSIIGKVPYGDYFGQLARLTDLDTAQAIIKWPELQPGDSLMDLQVVETQDRAWLGTRNGRVYELRGLNAEGTWTDITPPARHKNAALHVYGLAWMGWGAGVDPCLYLCEYSNAPDEIADPATDTWPQLHEYNTVTGEWRISGRFSGTRHLHALLADHGSALFVSAGDSGLPNGEPATGTGIYQLTPATRSDNAAELDNWERVTGAKTDGYNGLYPVDFILLREGGPGYPAGLYCAADQPGPHLLHVRTSGDVAGALGHLNQTIWAYNVNASPTETCRSIARAPDGTLLYLAVETDEPALYAAPPPYNQPLRLHRFDSTPDFRRGVIWQGHYLNWNNAWTLPRFG